MDLLKKLKHNQALDPNDRSNWYYKPNNYKKGLCNNCRSKLYNKGKSWATCEYHYLKKKYSTAKSRITRANENYGSEAYANLKGIKCSITWAQFVKWCTENQEYKKMKNPRLIRKNKKRNFTLKNILWVDGSNFP